MFLNIARTILITGAFFSVSGIPKGLAAEAQRPSPSSSQYDGMTLISIPVENGETFDVPVITSADALRRIKQALSVLMDRSPANAVQIRRLKARGQVTIVYDPHFPNTLGNPATLRVALFLPKYLLPMQAKEIKKTPEPAQKEFLVVIGRHGIKWPAADLAAVLVHELVGHGLQHLTDNRLDMRQMDIECEAWLYQEKAHQDFGLDKRSAEMVRFQQQLAFNCQEFIDYLNTTDPDTRQQWRRLNPDVPALLIKFKDYLAYLRTEGVVAKTRKFTKARRDKKLETTFKNGPASEIKRIGDVYQYGLGTLQDHATAAKWYRRAAESGCAEAQFILASLYLDGIGVARSGEEAYYWLSLVGRNASPGLAEKSRPLLKMALKNMTADQIAVANKRLGDVTPKSQSCK